MKKQLLSFASWSERHWIQIVILALLLMLVFLCLVFVSWLIGYWGKALLGINFDLSSCWQGVGTVGTGLGLVAALAKAAWTKYSTDSRFNSPMGLPIHKEETRNDAGGTSTGNCKRID